MKKIILNSLLLVSIITNAQCWKTVSVGEQHSVGLQTNGTLWGWGLNGDDGRVGNGSILDVLSPVQISTATDWKEVHAGVSHTFAIKLSGTLWAWGSNPDGKLGNGTTTPSSTPIQIGTSTWKMVKAGSDHSVGIKSDATLWAWGDNEKATLGDGTFVDKSVPTLISAATNWKMVSCNSSRNIALKEDGTLWVWGFNSPILGVTGMGSGTIHIMVPTQVGVDTDWKVAVAGNGYYLALKNNNTLWVWGGGANGCLGNGSTSAISFPTQIGIANDWETVEADGFSSFGLKIDGTLYAWGRNNFGNLGNGTQSDLLIPTQITTSNDYKGVATSVASTSAIKTDGSLYSWGINYWGNLGNGTYVESFTPELINQCNLNTDSFDKKKLGLYPNPVQHQLYISSKESQQYQIFSILGTKICEGTLAVGSGIDCSRFTSGVYLISLTDGAGSVSTAKFVKE